MTLATCNQDNWGLLAGCSALFVEEFDSNTVRLEVADGMTLNSKQVHGSRRQIQWEALKPEIVTMASYHFSAIWLPLLICISIRGPEPMKMVVWIQSSIFLYLYSILLKKKLQYWLQRIHQWVVRTTLNFQILWWLLKNYFPRALVIKKHLGQNWRCSGRLYSRFIC